MWIVLVGTGKLKCTTSFPYPVIGDISLQRALIWHLPPVQSYIGDPFSSATLYFSRWVHGTTERNSSGRGRAILHNNHIGRQPPFLANLWDSLPACPAHGALPETDGSRNVLEQSSEELLVAREAREGGRGARFLLQTKLHLTLT